MTDQTTSTTQPKDATPPTGPLSELVGPDKKFKTVDDLAKGKQESDAFISKLQDENAELRKLANTVGDLESKIKFLSELKSVTPTEPVTTPAPVTPQGTAPKGLTEEDVVRVMESRRAEERRVNNVREANAALMSQFGSEADAVLSLRARELGVSKEYLNEMAAQSPQAFYATIGFSPKGSSSSPTLSSRVTGQNVGGATPSSTGLRNEKYYNDLKAKMGAWKFAADASIQKQMWKDMEQLGERYYS
jgi:hypothetical protein